MVETMWLAMLLVCYTPDAQSCAISTQPDSLYYTEAECIDEVMAGMNVMGTQAFHVNGGCVKIGSST